MRFEDNYMEELVRGGVQLKIVGIVRPDEEATATSITGAVGYTHALTDYLVAETAKREIVKEQMADPDVDVFTGLTFKDVEEKQALAERAQKAEKAEEETTTAAQVSADGALHPTVGNLGVQHAPAVVPVATTMSEDEIRAYIEQNVPESDRAETLEFVDLFMKNTRTLRERRQMTEMLDRLLADYEVPGVGRISGDQAYSYILLLNRQQKLDMLTAMITGDTAFKIIMLAALPFIVFFVLRTRDLDVFSKTEIPKRRALAITACIALAVGFYDGFYGPGTGTFLMLLLTALAHQDVRHAQGTTKAVNLSTNLAALAVFAVNGQVLLGLGLVAGAFNIAGNWLGAQSFIGKGSAIARPVMLVVIVAFAVKLLVDIIAG